MTKNKVPALNRAARKLKNRSGETIAEVLVGVLIAAIAMTLLAGMVTAASSMIDSGKKRMTEYYNANSGFAEKDPSGATDSTAEVRKSDNTDYSIAGEDSILISYYENTAVGDTVIAYTGREP